MKDLSESIHSEFTPSGNLIDRQPWSMRGDRIHVVIETSIP